MTVTAVLSNIALCPILYFPAINYSSANFYFRARAANTDVDAKSPKHYIALTAQYSTSTRFTHKKAACHKQAASDAQGYQSVGQIGFGSFTVPFQEIDNTELERFRVGPGLIGH